MQYCCDRRKQQDLIINNETDKWDCYECGAPDDFNFCPYCGKKL